MSSRPTLPNLNSPVSPARPSGALDRVLLSGVAWTGGMKWATQILSWASTFIIARLLGPGDYGLMSMAVVYTGFVAPIYDFGLSATIVQRRHYTARDIAQLGGLALMFGSGFFLLSLAMARPLAAFYDEPAVRGIVVVVSVGFLITMFQMVPRASLTRELRFRHIALLDGLAALSLTIGTLTLAFMGYGYWALAFGVVVGAVITTPVAVLSRPHPLAWPRDRRLAWDATRFGGHVVAAQVAWYAYTHADFLIVGKVLGKEALGLYTIGWTVATIPVDRISELVRRVMPGVFSAIQTDVPAMRRYFLALSEGLAIVALPMSIGLALTADDLVQLLLEREWWAAGPVLRILALYAGVRSLATLATPILVATGHARRNMRLALFALLVLAPAFLVGARWGATGVAWAWVIGFPIVIAPLFHFLFRLLELPARGYLAALWPAIRGTAIMAAAVGAVRMTVPDGWPAGARLGVAVATGAAVYCAVIYTLHRDRVRAFLSLVRGRSTPLTPTPAPPNSPAAPSV